MIVPVFSTFKNKHSEFRNWLEEVIEEDVEKDFFEAASNFLQKAFNGIKKGRIYIPDLYTGFSKFIYRIKIYIPDDLYTGFLSLYAGFFPLYTG